VLLHVEHAALGLDVEAARIEAYALADERDLGMARLAPGEIDEARGTRGGAADRVNERKICLEEVIADDRAHLGAVALRQRACRRFEFGRPEVVRRRVDEIARKRDAVDDAGEILAVDVAGQLELHLFPVLLAVAGEAVCAEREGGRRECQVGGAWGEPSGARRQRRRERTRPKQVLARIVLALEREDDAGKRPVGRRNEEVAACLGFEAGGIGEGTRPRIKPLAQVAPRRRVNEGYRNRGGGVAAGKKDRMHRRAVLERALLARSVAAVKARGAGVTGGLVNTR